MENVTMKTQDLDIPLNGSVEMIEPSVFSVQINRWGREGSDECFIIIVKDGNGEVVHRSEFKQTIEGK